MARNRRNKRKKRNITKVINFKFFLMVLLTLSTIIVTSLSIIFYRNAKDKEMLVKQKEEIDKQINEIFALTANNIETSNVVKRDSIIKLSAVGDILCENEIIEDGYNKETRTYNFDSIFQNITQFLKQSDLVIGTMETNFVEKPYSGYGLRNSPKEFAKAVKKSGVNLVSISTNHTLDYGIDGIKSTTEFLHSIGIDTVPNVLGENRVNIKTIKDVKLAFLSYTCVIENKEQKSTEQLEKANMFNEEVAKHDLEFAKENADCILVIMHWGNVYDTKQSEEQEKIAEFLIDNGANIILGNHASVIQPMKIERNKDGENVFIAYSLGNYICADNTEKTKVELVLNIELKKNTKDGKVELNKVDYTPIYVLDNGINSENRYELIDMKGVAKAYASGEKTNINRQTYNKLLEGLRLLQSVIN